MIPTPRELMPRYVLIDDDPLYRAMFLRAARAEGIEVDVFGSLAELGFVGALGRYDAAIIDYDLEDLNGVEIAEYLSALFGDMPMVLVSGQHRTPGEQAWPTSIKKFVAKSDGYGAALREVQELARLRVKIADV